MTDNTEYSIALQRSIEHHCKGLVIPEKIAVICPYHAKMLNETLGSKTQLDADYKAIGCKAFTVGAAIRVNNKAQ